MSKLALLNKYDGNISLNHPLYAFSGKQMMVRDFCTLIAPHWPNSKVKALATALAESKLYLGAYHDNLADDGTVASRDCGAYQINIPSRSIGTIVEFQLRTEDSDPDVFMTVANNNVLAAYKLYTTAWTRDGKEDIRRWQPWVAYTSGWAMFPEFWVWHQDAQGNPIGPWVATGRYVQQAIRGIANWHLLIAKDMDSQQALTEAQRLSDYWGVKCVWKYSSTQNVYFVVPDKPTIAPADGIGPRPKSNDGI